MLFETVVKLRLCKITLRALLNGVIKLISVGGAQTKIYLLALAYFSIRNQRKYLNIYIFSKINRGR